MDVQSTMPFRKQTLVDGEAEFRFDFVLEPEPELPDFTIFHHFFALPKELREEIYTMIFNSPENATSRVLVRDQVRPIEPAICRVSKAIRDEALPLFYHLYELKIGVLTVVTKGRKPRLTFGTEFWQHNPLQKFRWLRHVTITFWDTALCFGRRLCVELTIRFFTVNGKHHYSFEVATDASAWRLDDESFQWPFSQSNFYQHAHMTFNEHADEVVNEIRAQSITVLDWLISDERYGNWTPADFKRLVEWNESLLHRS